MVIYHSIRGYFKFGPGITNNNKYTLSYVRLWIGLRKYFKEILHDQLIKSFDVCGINQNTKIHFHTALRHILTKLPVTKLNELDGSKMFVDLDDEHEDGDETDDNESEVESHNELVYF